MEREEESQGEQKKLEKYKNKAESQHFFFSPKNDATHLVKTRRQAFTLTLSISLLLPL